MAVYVVTGGGGFIGSHIVEELLRRNQTIRVIDNFSTGRRENLKPFERDIQLIGADIAGTPDLARHLRGADYVIHQAAIPLCPDPLFSRSHLITPTLRELSICYLRHEMPVSSALSTLRRPLCMGTALHCRSTRE